MTLKNNSLHDSFRVENARVADIQTISSSNDWAELMERQQHTSGARPYITLFTHTHIDVFMKFPHTHTHAIRYTIHTHIECVPIQVDDDGSRVSS